MPPNSVRQLDAQPDSVLRILLQHAAELDLAVDDRAVALSEDDALSNLARGVAPHQVGPEAHATALARTGNHHTQ
eukprot:6457246-Prymnesium_polylepis.1